MKKLNELLGWDGPAISSMIKNYLKENEMNKVTKLAKKLYIALFNRGALLQVNGKLYEPINTFDRHSPQGGCSKCALLPECEKFNISELCINIDLVGFTETEKPADVTSTVFKEYTGVMPPEKTVLIADFT